MGDATNDFLILGFGFLYAGHMANEGAQYGLLLSGIFVLGLF